MEKNLRLLITIGLSLVALAIVMTFGDSAEARPKPARKMAHKVAKKRTVAKTTTKKSMTPEQRRKHQELVEKLKEQDQQAKEIGAPGSMESSILNKSATSEKPTEQKQRSSASTPKKQVNDLAEVDLDFDDSIPANQYLPSATEEQLDSNGEF